MKRKLALTIVLVLVFALSLTIPSMARSRGDINDDSEIDMRDILELRKVIAGLVQEYNSIACDTNADKAIDMKDLLLLRKKVAGLAEVEPWPEESSTEPSQTQPSVTQPSETQPSETQPSVTQPSETQPSVTQPSQTQPSGDTVSLSLNIEEKIGQWDKQTRTDVLNVPKGENKIAFILPAVYKGAEDYGEGGKYAPATKLIELSYKGSPITPEVTFGKTEGGNNDIIFTYTIDVQGGETISGTASHPNFKSFIVSINGENQDGPDPTQAGTTTTTLAPGHAYAHDPEGSENIDLVTLTIQDENFSKYGVSFHAFKTLTTPVIQLVKGTAQSDAAFTSAQVITATQSSKAFKEHDAYNPTDYSFLYDWSRRGDIVYQITTYQYKGTLENLDPATTYSYRVGDASDGTFSPIYTFTTRPASVGDFEIIYTADTQPELGDNDAYIGTNKLFNKAFEQAPNAAFLVSGGDFVYCSDEGQGSISPWRRLINGSNNLNTGANANAGALFANHPWFVANGNHDNDYVQDFFNNGTTNNVMYYSYNYGSVHFIVLDSAHDGSISTNQLNWLQSDLEANAKNSNTKFTVVFIHWPFYCHEERDLNDANSKTALTYFDQYGVDFVVCAHVNEDYYTTYPINNGKAVAHDPVLDTTDNVEYYTNPGGTIFLQNAGSGMGGDLKCEEGVTYKGKKDGGKEYTYDTGDPNTDLMREATNGYEPSFAVIGVKGNKLYVKRYYLTNKGDTINMYTTGQVGVIKN